MGDDSQRFPQFLLRSLVVDFSDIEECVVTCERSKGFIYTWKYKMIVHIKPKTTEGRPSTISLAFILTSFIWKNLFGK